MKKSIKIKLLALSLSFSAVFYATSQVTIGMIDQPLDGTLLDLKESNTSNGGANSQKGLMLPRVSLTDVNSLSPILSGSDLSNASLKPNYTGLIVYNVSTTAQFVKGLYSWDGAKWNLLSPVSADNGLNITNSTVKLGGNLTQATNVNLNNNNLVLTSSVGSTTFDSSKGDLIFKSSQNKVTVGRVSINTPQEDTLHIKGRINLDEPVFSTDSQDHYLVLDNTGTMRCRPATVSRIDRLLLNGTTNWTNTPSSDILDFYFVDRNHNITLPTPSNDYRGKLIRFYIYGGAGSQVVFNKVEYPANWTCNVPGFTYSGTVGKTTGILTISDASTSTVRFRFIDIICDGEGWWVNNM